MMAIKAVSKVVFDMDLKCPYCSYETWYDLSSGNFIRCDNCHETFYAELRIVSSTRELTDEERQERDTTCSDQTGESSSSEE